MTEQLGATPPEPPLGPLSKFLYQIDTADLFQEQRRAFLENCVRADFTSQGELALLIKGYEMAQKDVWQALCEMAEGAGADAMSAPRDATRLYNIDSGELIGALVEKFAETPCMYAEVKAFELGAQRLWEALSEIECAQQNAAVDAELAKLREEWTQI